MTSIGRYKSGLSRALAFCAALMLAACVRQGDLGRDSPDTGWAKLANLAAGSGEQALVQTPAEQDLRAVATAISAAPSATEPDFLTRVSRSFEKDGSVAPSLVYYTKLRAAHPTSLVSLVNTIGDDVQIDTVRLAQFSNICDEVNSTDAVRAESLIGAPSAKTTIASEDPVAFRGVRMRLIENGQVMDNTFAMMEARLVSYRTALAHARLDSDGTVDMDVVAAAITRLDDELTRLDHAARRHQAIQLSLISGTES
ncbi:MAG: hypothetical protein Q7T44_11040 [Parvibaculum sp.]|nr:hypothetical protein [Parvibaculum sp.]